MRAASMLSMLSRVSVTMSQTLDTSDAYTARFADSITDDVREIADLYRDENGVCRRCKHALVGECVDIVSGLSGYTLRTHLACVEDGDELA